MPTDESLQERDDEMLSELESERLHLLESRSGLDPWSEAWDKAKARYQEIERKINVIVTQGTARYYR
jgi:hypothetical protein